MSTAALSVRSNGSSVDMRSSRKFTDDYYNWDRDALPSQHDTLEQEPSGGSLPRTVSREASRAPPRPASVLSNHNTNVSNGGGARSHRSTISETTKNQLVGTVQPWDEEAYGLEPEPDGLTQPELSSRSRRSPVPMAPPTELPDGGRDSPPPLSREGSRLSGRPGSTALSHRSRFSGGGGSRKPSAMGEEEGAGVPDDGPLGLEEDEPFQDRRGALGEDEEDDGGYRAEGEDGSPPRRMLAAETWLGEEDDLGEEAPPLQDGREPFDGEGEEEAAGELPEEHGSYGGYGFPTDPSAMQSDRDSRPGSTGGAPPGMGREDVSGTTSPVPKAPSRDGTRPSARTPSVLSHRSGPSNAGGGAAGGNGSRRQSAVPYELQDLPPEALPWSEPPKYVSRVSSTVSVNDQGVGTPAPPYQEHSRASVRASSAAPSNRSEGHKSAGGRTPVEIPLLPLRDLIAGGGSRPAPTTAAGTEQPAPLTPTAPSPPQTQPSVPVQAPPLPSQPSAPSLAPISQVPEDSSPLPSPSPPPPLAREGSRTSVRPPSVAASGRSFSHKTTSQRSALEIPNQPPVDPDGFGGCVAPRPGGAPPLEPPQPCHDSPRQLGLSRDGSSRVSLRPSSANSSSKTPFARKSATDWHQELIEPLPWSACALTDFRAQLKKTSILMGDPSEDPLTARMDTVFALPPELWPVLPPGAMYCLEASDPRATFGYLQHCDFPDIKVRVNTYFGKWGRHLVDYVVSWQPTPRAEAAWQLADGKQPPLPWEQRQVVAHTTNGEYQYANTRMRFRGPKSAKPDSEVVEYCDAHAVDLLDTKAANETAPRNSDKDREAHLIDPPRPNTWGELARRPLIGNLRSRGGGTYVHHINYDHSSLRTTCGRRVPAGYFFTLIPNASAKTPAVPGHASIRASSVGRSIAGGLRSNGEASSMRIRSANGPIQALLSTFGDSVSSSKWGAYVGGASSLSIGIGGGATGGGSRPSSAGPRRPDSAGRLPQLPSCAGPSELGAIRSAWSSVGGGIGLQREGSRLGAPTSPTLVALASKQRWRTYDVPFNHPIHSTRAQELGAELAVASGRGVRTFSDAAAVLQVSEQELRLPRAFVPGPVVVPTWDDIPRLYAEHMEAARALMPVTELDNYGSSKLHMLIYHLQCAATLEYDRLDAKLLLLPQMARLGRKSAEIDAWLQVIVEHAAYLYDNLEITDRARWRPAPTEHPPMRRSVTFAKATALSNPTSSAWNFPDPLVGTSFATRSALNVAVQNPQPHPSTQLPAAFLSPEEWAAINKIMDTCRHAVLHDHWVRLRPVMTGAAAPGNGSSYGSSRAGSMIAASSDAGATASGEGDRLPGPQDPYAHGSVNRELLDYVKADLDAMSSPDFTPQPPAIAKVPKQRGYRGEGPLPPELVAEMPTVHRPVRCRGADETPLPPEYQTMDLWNVRHKAEQVDLFKAPPDVPSPRDSGALRFSQVSVMRLQAAKGFADTRQAEIRRSMQRANGITVFDDDDVPEYGSDVADDDVASVATSFSINTVDGRPRRRRHPTGPIKKVEPVVPGIACQTAEEDIATPEALHDLEESKSRMMAEAAEARRLLLTGNGGKTREQVLEDALKAAESAIESLKPRPIGATPLSEPDSPNTYTDGKSVDTMDAAWRPFGRGPEYSRSTSFAPVKGPGGGDGKQDQQKRPGHKGGSRSRSGHSGAEGFGKGPEPFSLEKLTAEPSVVSEGEVIQGEVPKTTASSFGGVNIGVGGLVDYETAMARRRAIAGAEVARDRSHFIPKSEVLNLFVTYCNLGGHPDLIEMLTKAVEAPVSTVTVSAVTKAVSAISRNATAGRTDVDSEVTRQRIRGTAWLLGVTWRRITNETYTSFLSRVLGWPGDFTSSLHRTRATQIIARALVRGHDANALTKAPPRH
ncbi:hypothetical protein VaNZ11_011254 [Volvox africanus]|uniref:Uncharacterized protein n=1 Tax=Volvox africanus TaxID=51714 RepID=A0ABQ5SBB2_9CHLO|nr:hypothetical protein VaNZ11_011254 [Volvox africanus]